MQALGEQILNAVLAASNPDVDTRRSGEAQLEQLKARDANQFFAACAFIFTEPSVAPLGRQQIGLLIKNSMMNPACSGNPELQQRVIGSAIVDPQKNVRNAASSIISNAVRSLQWPLDIVAKELCGIIARSGADAANISAVHGATRALSQVVDDCIYLLDQRKETGGVVVTMLPLLGYPVDTPLGKEIRERALDAFNTVLEQAGIYSDSFSFSCTQPHIVNIINGCFENLRNPPSNELAAKCVKCIVLSLTFYTSITSELFNNITALMLQATLAPLNGNDETLQIEATEFWRAVLLIPHFAEHIVPTFEHVIPALISAMHYSDMEISMLQANSEDWNVPDKVDDIKPRHYQARTAETNDEDDDDEDAEEQEWNLRRVSASTLDSIAEHYGEAILDPVLRIISTMMQPNAPWKDLEAAILALGAIMDGCFPLMGPYLPDISERILCLLEDPSTHFLVVNISLWAMVKIGEYVVEEKTKLQRLVQCIFKHMLSHSKLVQGAAVSALTELVAFCENGQLNDGALPIVQCIAQCMGNYQLKNRVALLEALETVCDYLVEPLSQTPACLDTLMQPLGVMWLNTSNEDPTIFSFFSCMSCVCRTFGSGVQPLAKDIFERSFSLLHHHVHARQAAQQANLDPPESEYLITAADLLSGLFDAIGSGLEPLMAQTPTPFMQTILPMLVDEEAFIRASGFALMGDIAKACPKYVQLVLADYSQSALLNLKEVSDQTYTVVSHVSWSVSNILEYQMDLDNLPTLTAANALPQMFTSLARILASPSITADMRNMAENICLSLGMMLYYEPNIASVSGTPATAFAVPWMQYMRNVKDVPQKEQAVSGFLMAFRGNIAAMASQTGLFLDMALSLVSASPDIKNAVKDILKQLRQGSPQNWNQAMAQFNPHSSKRLSEVYGI